MMKVSLSHAFFCARVGSCAEKLEFDQVRIEADGLEVREKCCEGSVFHEDFLRVAPQVDVVLPGPRLSAVGLCCLQRCATGKMMLVSPDRLERCSRRGT